MANLMCNFYQNKVTIVIVVCFLVLIKFIHSLYDIRIFTIFKFIYHFYGIILGNGGQQASVKCADAIWIARSGRHTVQNKSPDLFY